MIRDLDTRQLRARGKVEREISNALLCTRDIAGELAVRQGQHSERLVELHQRRGIRAVRALREPVHGLKRNGP